MSGAHPLRAAVAVFALLLHAAGCRMPPDTAAVVDGRVLTTTELEEEVRSLTAGLGQGPNALERELPRIRRAALERLVDRELMLAEAARRGIRPEPSEVERALSAGGRTPPEEVEAALDRAGSDRERWRHATGRDLAVGRLQELITATVSVDEREVTDRVARPGVGGERPEEVRASQILLRDEGAANAARRRILGGAAFADVAREVSLSPDAERGGDLGFFARGQMPPEFEEVAFALPAGQLSGVVETPYGFHLFLVTDRRDARRPSEAEERAAARVALLAEKREAAFRAWLADARLRATIRYNPSLLRE